MAQIDRRELEALVHVRSNEVFVKFLESRVKDYQTKMSGERDEVSLRMFQGRAQEVEELLNLIQRSSEYLKK